METGGSRRTLSSPGLRRGGLGTAVGKERSGHIQDVLERF